LHIFSPYFSFKNIQKFDHDSKTLEQNGILAYVFNVKTLITHYFP